MILCGLLTTSLTLPIKKQKTPANNDGFTLVELLIVIALIGILAAVALVVINPAAMQDRAKQGAVAANIEKMGIALSACYITAGVVSASDVAYCDSWTEVGVVVPTQPAGWTYAIASAPSNGYNYVFAYPTSCTRGGADSCCEIWSLLFYDFRTYLSKSPGFVNKDNDCDNSTYTGELGA